jgi:hypothetical protein
LPVQAQLWCRVNGENQDGQGLHAAILLQGFG